MSLLKGTIDQLASVGVITKEVTVEGMKILLGILSVEEQIISDSLINNKSLLEKFGAKREEMVVLADTVGKFRSISTLCFAIKSINGQIPVDKNETMEKQFEQRLEFREELSALNVSIIDLLMKEYTNLVNEHKKFFEDVEKTAGK